MTEYTIILDPDPKGQGYTVTVPALPGCITQGRTRHEAIKRAREAIALYIESLVIDGQPVPAEDHPVELIRLAI